MAGSVGHAAPGEQSSQNGAVRIPVDVQAGSICGTRLMSGPAGRKSRYSESHLRRRVPIHGYFAARRFFRRSSTVRKSFLMSANVMEGSLLKSVRRAEYFWRSGAVLSVFA